MVQHPAWTLIVIGCLILLIGLVWMISPSIPWLGKLPGDIAIERGNFSFYFPVMTCILLSFALTVIMWLMRYFSR